MAKALTVADVILGEAAYGTPEERLEDMMAIASVIANRAEQLGVTPEEVVSAPGEFSAYNKDLPAGVEAYRDLAEQAIADVEKNGPVNNATFYATPSATGGLPKGLEQTGKTAGHVYFSDPLNRAIQTAAGYKQPTGGIMPANAEMPAATSEPPLGIFGAGPIDYARTGPAGLSYGDLVAPTSVKTTAISASGPGLAALAPNGLQIGGAETMAPSGSSIEGLNWDGRTMDSIEGLAIHHTGGIGTPEGVIDTLNERGFGAHYVMDRAGNIYSMAPDNARLSHIKDAQNNSGLTNDNTIGIEVIASDDQDVTPAQIESAQSFISDMQAKHPGIGDNIFGHGELNKHKMADEGMSIVDAYRQAKGLPAWDQFTGTFGAPIPEPRPLSQEEFAVASAPLPPVAPTPQIAAAISQPENAGLLGVPAPETVSPLGLFGETVDPSRTGKAVAAIASMLSPVSSAQAAAPVPSEVVAPAQATERVVGTEPAASSFPARPEVVGALPAGLFGGVEPSTQQPLQNAALGSLPATLRVPNFASQFLTGGRLLGTAVPLDQQGAILAGQQQQPTLNAPAPVQLERISPIQTATSVQPQVTETVAPNQPGLGTNGTLFHNPVYALAQPEMAATALAPLGTTEIISPTSEAAILGPQAPAAQSALLSSGLLGTPATLDQQGAALAATLGTQQQKTAQPAATTATAPTGVFPSAPAAPKQPTRFDRIKQDMPSAMKRAALGAVFGGLPGGAIGLASGLLGGQIGNAGLFGPGFDSLVDPADRFSVGVGLKGMQSAINGPKGATAKASNGSTYTSLGPGKGGLRHSAKYGWTEVVSPSGETVGINYANGGGGLLGDISRSLGGLFGGADTDGGFSQAEKDKYGGAVGLF